MTLWFSCVVFLAQFVMTLAQPFANYTPYEKECLQVWVGMHQDVNPQGAVLSLAPDACRNSCEEDPKCYSFEIYANHGSTAVDARTANHCRLSAIYDAQAKVSSVIMHDVYIVHTRCDGSLTNTDVYVKTGASPVSRYSKRERTCLEGKSTSEKLLATTSAASVADCAQQCDLTTNCVSFEYFHDYRGTGYRKNGLLDYAEKYSCRLTSLPGEEFCEWKEQVICNGAVWNSDMYFLSDPGCPPPPVIVPGNGACQYATILAFLAIY